MRLTEKEYYRFLGIYLPLIYFVGIEKGIIPKNMSFEDFENVDFETKYPVRDALYDYPEYFDKFVKENPFNLSKEDLKVVDNFKSYHKGQFWVLKYMKKHAIFLDEDFAYGVVALSDPFESFFGNHLPSMIETVLLPFEGKIIYDGMMITSNMIIGRNMTASLNREYNLLKDKYGLITQLPIDQKIKNLEQSDENILIAFMKSRSSIDEYWYEIGTLLDRNPSLQNLYEQLWGKVNSRNKKKILKELGITGHHFAITGDTIIASGKSKTEVEEMVKSMLGNEMLDAIHYFKI